MNHECECGNPRRPTQSACDRCSYLDGGSGAELRLIAALREMGGEATAHKLAQRLGVTLRYVRGLLRRLRESGRVTRRLHGVNERAIFYLADHHPAEPTCITTAQI